MAERSNENQTTAETASREVLPEGGETNVGGRQWASLSRRDRLWGLILLVAVFLTYTPVWWAGFVWDDDMYLTANPCIVGPLGLKEIWTTSAADVGPFTLTTFWLEHKLWGLAPLPYHLVNVLLHGTCALLLWYVLRALLVPGAWLGAALWALHPVQVESVAWIAEMKNTESGVFFLLSILFFVKDFTIEPSGERIGWNRNYVLTLLFAALAMASKSSTVILPVVLCLCAWWTERRWRWRNLIKVSPILLMSVIASVATMWIVNPQGGVNAHTQWSQTWPERLIIAGDAVWFYLGKLVWPHPLMAFNPRWKIDASWWLSYSPLLAVVLIGTILWWKRKSWFRPLFFASAFFLAALLPVLGLVDHVFMRFTFVAYHFQYLASIGPLALAGAGMSRWTDTVLPKRPWLRSSLGIGILLILGTLTWQRAWVYIDAETFWRDTLAQNPNNSMAHCNLGIALYEKGLVVEAIDQFQSALEIDPSFNLARTNLGEMYEEKGQHDEAIAEYQKVLKIDPNEGTAHYDLANVYFHQGRDEAIAEYQRALKINPYQSAGHSSLGHALLLKGQWDEAIIEIQKSLDIDPNDALAHYDLGKFRVQKGQLDLAIVEFQRAVELSPHHPEVHNDLGDALLQKGRVADATAQYQEALRVKPDFRPAQENLAKAQAMERQKTSQQ